MSAYCSPLQISIINFSSEYLRRQTLKPNEMKERTTPYKSDPKDDIVEANERAGEEDKENKMGESFKGFFSLFSAQSAHIELASPQAGQLSLF